MKYFIIVVLISWLFSALPSQSGDIPESLEDINNVEFSYMSLQKKENNFIHQTNPFGDDWSTGNKIWLGVTIVTSVADIHSTDQGINRENSYCYETNVILPDEPTMEQMALLKVAVLLPAYYLIEFIFRDSTKSNRQDARNIVYGIVSIATGAIAIKNYNMDCSNPD